MEPRDVTPSPCGRLSGIRAAVLPTRTSWIRMGRTLPGQPRGGTISATMVVRPVVPVPSATDVGPATVPETAGADSAASVVRYQVPEPVPEFRATVPSGTVSSVVEEDFTFQNHRAGLPGVAAVTGAWVCAPAGKASVFVATVAGSIGAAPE